MKRGTLGLGLALAVALLAVAVAARGGEQQEFPHEAHAGLFPFCIGCHEGVPTGDFSQFYPEPQLCAGCHDGDELPEVSWQPPVADEPDPTVFTHPDHIAALSAAGEDELECEACHVQEGEPRMAIEQELVLEQCFSCHGHPAEDHVVDAPCSTCHRPAAETEMGGAWLATLPYPADHARGDFLPEVHGRLAATETSRCATCHTQERCTSCHVNAESVQAIAAIPEAPPSLELPRYAAHYFVPPSHEAPGFLDGHGALASVENCSTCHTQNDCAACHTGELPVVAVALPEAGQVRAPGVLLEPKAPSTHTMPSFMTEHGALAAADAGSCTSCHTRSECSDCHTATSVQATLPPELAGPVFHPPNYLARHAADAYGRQLECSSCHDVAAFCRDCHEQAGFGSRGMLDAGYHDAEPNWLLRHGLPARQGLESCASCHEQSDCLQCHSTLGAFKISPHGRDFDPQRAQEKNPAICFACHVEDPIG
ncbi:MAG: cytochrome c3 family protein [Gemmatimonadota bacterium]